VGFHVAGPSIGGRRTTRRWTRSCGGRPWSASRSSRTIDTPRLQARRGDQPRL
jgi:hypothetical protein